MGDAWGVILALTIIFWFIANDLMRRSRTRGTVILSYRDIELTINGTVNFVVPILGFLLTVIAYLAKW